MDNKCLVDWCRSEAERLNKTVCFKHYQRYRLTGSYEPQRHYLSEIDLDSAIAFCEMCKGFVPIHTGRIVCKESKANAGRKERYGITATEYGDMVIQQDRKCAICNRHAKLYVDHDHLTGKIRGLLCSKCNLALGHFEDNGDTIKMALKYIEKGGIK